MAIVQNKLGRYDLIREITRSNDIVYEGWDARFNRKVAVKVLDLSKSPSAADRADRMARFEREARAAGSLEHPNIMHVFDSDQLNGVSFLVMEFLDGHSLHGELEGRGPFDLQKMKRVLQQVLAALEYAHGKGVVHRDLKPANIQLLPTGEVKLMDFGIARLTYEPTMTQTGLALGSVHFMSPEQALGKHVDPRSDLFSVGTISYVLLTGDFPFAGPEPIAIAMSIVNTEPTFPSHLDRAVVDFIKRALEKDPDRRFQSAAEMKSCLKALGPRPVAAAPPAQHRAQPAQNAVVRIQPPPVQPAAVPQIQAAPVPQQPVPAPLPGRQFNLFNLAGAAGKSATTGIIWLGAAILLLLIAVGQAPYRMWLVTAAETFALVAVVERRIALRKFDKLSTRLLGASIVLHLFWAIPIVTRQTASDQSSRPHVGDSQQAVQPPVASETAYQAAREAEESINGITKTLGELRSRLARGELTKSEAQSNLSSLEGKLSDALSQASQALNTDAGCRNAYLQKARALFYLGRYDESEQTLALGLQRFPGGSDLLELKKMVDGRMAAKQRSIL